MGRFKQALIGAVLLSASLSSFADKNNCVLGQYCPMPRASDYVVFYLDYTDEGGVPQYNCTLSVDGEYDRTKVVQVSISAGQGLEMVPMSFSAHQGGSSQTFVNARFSEPHVYLQVPKMIVRRLPNDEQSSTNNASYIMCEQRGTQVSRK